ncbi:T9SS type A sorting domain-containing protein [Crocinitomicaceae bacterium]|nr:T9SS type A sorting domain-containing protein [Crocinitomicaceae bacterium]
MKKIYLLASSIAFGSLAFGQEINSIHDFNTESLKEKKQTISFNSSKKIKTSFEKAAGDTIYSTDFSAGLGATGIYSAWTTSGGNGNVWLADMDGPNGSFSDPTDEIIESTTAANGFVIFDSDFASGTPASTPPDLSGNLHSPVIDLSGQTGLLLTFQNRYRHCCNSIFYPIVEVTTDNFTTVREFNVEVNGINGNDDSGTITTSINLSEYLSTASNLSNFQFRFVWKNARRYFWQIDDIAIVESLADDAEITTLILNRVLGDDNTIYTNLKEYTSIPTFLADTLSVQAFVKNNGSNSIPSNSTLTLTIFNDQNTPIISGVTGGSVSGSVNKLPYLGDTITFDTEIFLGDLTPGTYRILADLASNDDNTDNDTMSRTFVIDDMFLGQENYDIGMMGITSNGYNPTNPQDKFLVGNEYFFPAVNDLAEVNIDGLEIVLGQNATYSITPNTEILVKVYEVQTGAVYVEVDQARLFTITPDMIPSSGNTNRVILNFYQAEDLTGSINLETNKKYVIGIEHNGGDQSFAYGVQGMDSDFSSRTLVDGTWYWNGEHFLSRLVFDQTLGLEENTSSISIGNIYPNPTSGVSTVSYSLQNSSEVSVNIVDITGKKVYDSKEGQKVSGKHTLDIDATEFNNGVYYVTISTDEEIVTKKLIKK